MIAVGVGILVALVATVVFFVVYNSSRKGWQQSLTARESEAADLKVRNGAGEKLYGAVGRGTGTTRFC